LSTRPKGAPDGDRDAQAGTDDGCPDLVADGADTGDSGVDRVSASATLDLKPVTVVGINASSASDSGSSARRRWVALCGLTMIRQEEKR
jgi:hypothetical protein